jgi:hypothetical protein
MKSSTNDPYERIQRETHEILAAWIESCTRGKKVSRNTIAIGIVVFDHLLKACPVERAEAISSGGEIKGARSGLGAILARYGLPPSYLKEVTTRQGHQDGQRLFEGLGWGNRLTPLGVQERETLIKECIEVFVKQADEWLKQQNLKLQLDRRQAPTTWINLIVEGAATRSSGVVEQHLVGAKLQRRFPAHSIGNFPAHAGDQQTARHGDFVIAGLVYHVTAYPLRSVIQKCEANVRAGLHPILLVPAKETNRARVLAQEENVEGETTILSIEDFIAVNIIEMATTEQKDFYAVLQEIVELYNKRLTEVETDLSLQIQLQ